MKKEIIDLLALHNDDKTLKINGAFELQARYADKYGVNVALSKNDPVSVHLDLVYTLPHDKLLFTAREINARDYTGVVDEVCEKMGEIYNEISRTLATQFRAGYLG